MVSGMCESGSHRRQKLTKLFGVPSVYFLAEGIIFPSVGFFLVDFIDGLGTNARSMGFVHSLYLGLIILLGPIATTVAKRFGNRATILIGCFMAAAGLMVTSQVTHMWQIFVSHSFVTGLGMCLLTQGMVYDLASTFNKSASLYIGFMYAGSSVGFILNPLIFSQVRLLYGWRGTILIGSAVSMHMLPLVLILFRNNSRPISSLNLDDMPKGCRPTEEDEREDANNVEVSAAEKTSTDHKHKQCGDDSSPTTSSEDIMCELSNESDPADLAIAGVTQQPPTILMFFKVPSLFMMATVYFFGRFAYIGFFVHFSASLILRGFSEQDAALVFTAYGLGGLFGKSCSGLPAQFGIMSNYNFYMLSMFVIGFCFVIFSSISNLAMLLTCGFVVGGFIGVFVGLFPTITQSCVPEEWFNFAYGHIGIPTGLSSALGGYIMGAVYDMSGVYTTSFYIAGVCFFFNGFLMLFKICISKFYNKLKENSSKGLQANDNTNKCT